MGQIDDFDPAEIDLSDVDWKATAENLQREVNRLRPVVEAAATAVEGWDNGEWQTGPRGTEAMRALAGAVETAEIPADPEAMVAIAEGTAATGR